MTSALPVLLAVHRHEVTAMLIVLVGLVSAALAVVGLRAARRSGNRNLHFVTAAFSVFAVKSLFTGWAVWSRSVEHENLELVIAIGDLVIIILLVFPLLGRWRRGAAWSS